MLLKYILTSMVVFSATTALAAPITVLKTGKYDLIAGDKDVCGALNISDKDIKEDTIQLGPKEIFPINSGKLEVPSDLDENCTATETTVRSDDNAKTTIKRTNETVCKGKKTTSYEATVVISRDTVNMAFKEGGKVISSCIYKLK